MEDLRDTVVVVTGASSGIGRATARELLAAGARVVIGARRRDRLEAIEAEYPGQAVAVAMDVRSPDDCRRLVDTAITQFGRIDSLIANAGIGMYGGILDQTDEALATMLDTNVAGTVWPIRAAVPHMIEAGRGDIVIVASVAGFRSGADEAVYAATKFAQIGLAGGLDRELREKGHPGHRDRAGRDRPPSSRSAAAGPRTCPSCTRTCDPRTSPSRSARSSSSRDGCGRSSGRSGAWPREADRGAVSPSSMAEDGATGLLPAAVVR